MHESLAILSESVRSEVSEHQLQVLAQQERRIPNSVEYTMLRLVKQPGWQVDEVGMLAYDYVGRQSDDNSISLRFCQMGQSYCNEAGCRAAGFCSHSPTIQPATDSLETVDVYLFRFTTGYLRQFAANKGATGYASQTERYLAFDHPESVTHTLSLCSKSRLALTSLFNHKYDGTLENIFINSQIQFLLANSLDCLFGEGGGERDKIYQCKFLGDERGRESIEKARELLLQHIGDPITIKELARKVATNECYLKKGFKEMFGTTIFEFYQNQRMEHAKYLLYDKGLSVTDVSALLGYSSISHFSTAFKKYTGLKPCELLIR